MVKTIEPITKVGSIVFMAVLCVLYGCFYVCVCDYTYSIAFFHFFQAKVSGGVDANSRSDSRGGVLWGRLIRTGDRGAGRSRGVVRGS